MSVLSQVIRLIGRLDDHQDTLTARVLRVIDGDTIDTTVGKVRLVGVDAPESVPPRPPGWYGRQAARRLRRLIRPGSKVRLEFQPDTHDRYGRLLCDVYAGQTWVNGWLVERGLARERSYAPNTRHRAELRRLEAEARRRGRGMWADRPIARWWFGVRQWSRG